MDAADRYFLSMNNPKDYQSESPENILNAIDLSFEDACASLEEAGVLSPKGLTVFEFNQRVEYYRKKHTQNKAT